MHKTLALIAALAAALAGGWYWQQRGASNSPATDTLAQTENPTALPESPAGTEAQANTAADAAADVAAEAVTAAPDSENGSAAAKQAQIAAEAAIAAADRAAATQTAEQAATQVIPAEPAPAFVDVGKMRDIVENSSSMSAEVKVEILQLLDAAALDPTRLDDALVKYRAALQ